jgi:hypothetical protein
MHRHILSVSSSVANFYFVTLLQTGPNRQITVFIRTDEERSGFDGKLTVNETQNEK